VEREVQGTQKVDKSAGKEQKKRPCSFCCKRKMQGRRAEITVEKKKVVEGKEHTKNLLEAETDFIFGFTLKSVWRN